MVLIMFSSVCCSEPDDMVFEEFKRVYLKGVVYGDDDESPAEVWTTKMAATNQSRRRTLCGSPSSSPLCLCSVLNRSGSEQTNHLGSALWVCSVSAASYMNHLSFNRNTSAPPDTDSTPQMCSSKHVLMLISETFSTWAHTRTSSLVLVVFWEAELSVLISCCVCC